MHIILLRFAENKSQAAQFMDGHRAWIAKGMTDGVFLVAGRLQPEQGGAILAHGESNDALQARVAADPFVRESVVTAEILEVTPAKTDQRLDFLMEDAA